MPLALALVTFAGCAISSMPDDAGMDAASDGDANDAASDTAVDSAWCRAVTCEVLYWNCHANICDSPPRSFAPCFDARSGVCSTYTCTLPCIGDAGNDAAHCGRNCEPCCAGSTCAAPWVCNGGSCRGGAPCDAGTP